MSDLIRLLPDHVANQIAAGEVVQRPSSAVKELLENSIDAGATSIRIVIKDAGKTLIQVTDNGSGMSERDARMCFERHATSKIQTANDLLAIHTLGFRGEALASIASIAQVEMKTKKVEEDTGTEIQIEGSEFKSQLPSPCPDGTTVSVKNLFFNVPARRNFLKSNTLELKYILDEFFRVALVNPDVSFSFYIGDKILHKLLPSNLKQRIVGLFGTSYQQKLIPVEQSTTLVNIAGFIGKPEFARKTRGEQFFFANGRFIKNPYLHHAVESAFQELIPSDAFPTYFIYLTVDPATIDVNIHPTKTEINFQDAKSIYSILHSAVRQSIGKFNISPSLDFEADKSFDLPYSSKDKPVNPPVIQVDPEYNPFEKKVNRQMEISLPGKPFQGGTEWKQLYDPLKNIRFTEPSAIDPGSEVPNLLSTSDPSERTDSAGIIIQVHNRYLVTHTKRGIVVIDQQNAHERILFEKIMAASPTNPVESQQLLVPETITLNPVHAEIMTEYLTDFEEAGFGISKFGGGSFLVSAVPADCINKNIPEMIEAILESLQTQTDTEKKSKHRQFAINLAKTMAVKRGRKLQPEEMFVLVENLFACQVPDVTPDGKSVLHFTGFEELIKKFK